MDKITNLLLRLPFFGGEKAKLSQPALIAVRALCLLLALALAGGAFYIARERHEVTTSVIYEAKATNSASYTVHLNENNYFPSGTLDMGKNYIRSLIKDIDVEFKYKLDASGDGSARVTYSVVGEMSTWQMEYNQEKQLWSTTKVLSSGDVEVVSGSDCEFSVPVTIDQANFAQILNKFNEQLDLTANGYYDVTFSVLTTYTAADGSKKIDTSLEVVSIPLNGKVFTPVVKSDKEPAPVSFTREDDKRIEPNWRLVALAGILSFLSLLAFGVTMLCLEKQQGDPYTTALNAKIASIEDRIAYIHSTGELSGENIELADFDSIVRMADERILPILCAKDDNARRAVFFVTENSQKFYYIFDESKVAREEEENDDGEEA